MVNLNVVSIHFQFMFILYMRAFFFHSKLTQQCSHFTRKSHKYRKMQWNSLYPVYLWWRLTTTTIAMCDEYKFILMYKLLEILFVFWILLHFCFFIVHVDNVATIKRSIVTSSQCRWQNVQWNPYRRVLFTFFVVARFELEKNANIFCYFE